MHIPLFIMAGLLLVTWFVNLVSSSLMSGQLALQSFIGAGVCLGLGAVVLRLNKIAKPSLES